MENASKALLIAAAVLIVILLIAMGVRVFNSTSGTTDSLESTMSSTEVVAFNNKFTGYLGTQSTAKAKTLVNMVLANNQKSAHKIEINYRIYEKKDVSYSTGDEPREVSQNTGTATGLLTNLSNTIYSKVVISIEEYDNNGYIKVIKFDNKTIRDSQE